MSLEGLTLLLKEAMTAEHVHHRLKHVNTRPTQAQLSYGNYRKGHISVSGIPISIENPKGSYRSGITKDGKPWKTQLQHHYGYVKGYPGYDGDLVDCFVNPDNPESFMVYVVLQKEPTTGKFDEHKVMLGFRTRKEAEEAYHQNYQKGWKGMGGVLSMTIYGFRQWLKAGNARKNAQKLMKEAGVIDYIPAAAHPLAKTVIPAAKGALGYYAKADPAVNAVFFTAETAIQPFRKPGGEWDDWSRWNLNVGKNLEENAESTLKRFPNNTPTNIAIGGVAGKGLGAGILPIQANAAARVVGDPGVLESTLEATQRPVAGKVLLNDNRKALVDRGLSGSRLQNALQVLYRKKGQL